LFYGIAVLLAIECVIYTIFGTGVEQAWNKIEGEAEGGTKAEKVK